jgi:hypothetical protein
VEDPAPVVREHDEDESSRPVMVATVKKSIDAIAAM